jgi:hypothetical protein
MSFFLIASGGQGALFINIIKKHAKKQAFEMTPRKNGIRLTVKRVGSPTPLRKPPPGLLQKLLLFKAYCKINSDKFQEKHSFKLKIVVIFPDL